MPVEQDNSWPTNVEAVDHFRPHLERENHADSAHLSISQKMIIFVDRVLSSRRLLNPKELATFVREI